MSEEITVEALVRNLLELRRGHGLLSTDAPARAGTAVRWACGIEPNDLDADVRRKLLLHLGDLAKDLPEYVRYAVQGALALHPDTRHRYLHERMQWAAQRSNRDHARTAQRRVEKGMTLLAEQLIMLGPSSHTHAREWYTRRLDAVLRMDLAMPVLTEARTLRSLVDDLDEITAQLAAPQDDRASTARIRATMVYGGEIVEQDLSSPSYAEFTVRLPRPLLMHEEHDYSVEFTGLERAQMRPYCALTPLRRCERFSLRVRFAADNLPQRIWSINGAVARRVDDFQPTSEILHLDAVHELTVTFTEMTLGLTYGVQWIPGV